ncbi:pyrethroid hydrolase Ces2e isoform X2 [Monodelphis domestica]|uniref:pyrethroid hydrolase Ces2e isoform X2 n=1 Tax=Monodelphis domestica TaxID=13616 RepID=UPI0004432B7E|nr:pyrethroid hydrolase Ces2e isoform X2 [Monodelphis domestica]
MWKTSLLPKALTLGVLCFLISVKGHKADDLIRTTESGQVQGTQISIKKLDKSVDVFLGIPFAKPPIGALRFSPPQAPDSWNNVRDATSYPPMCLQDGRMQENMGKALKIKLPKVAISEDCLYLNIYVPGNTKEGDRLPVLSPMSKGLFHRAIMESGVAILPGLIASSSDTVTNLVANLSACERSSSASMVQCLRSKSEEEMLAMTKLFKIIPGVVDGKFLPRHPEELLAAGEFHHVPCIIGVNNHEYGWSIPAELGISELKEKMDKGDIQSTVQGPLLGIPPELGHLMIEEYLGDIEDPRELRVQYQEMMGDWMFVIPALKVAKYQHSSSSPVYFYEFQHRPSLFKDSKPDFVKADHGDELLFTFGWSLLGDTTEEEKVLSHKMMSYWANFARHGNPNGADLLQWPAYGQNEEYMQLNLQLSVGKSLKGNKLEFWTKTVPQKMKESLLQKGRMEL